MSRRKSPWPMISIPEALEIVLKHSEPSTIVELGLGDCQGLILAEDIFAGEPLPPFPASVKDGYAIVAADGVGTFPVVGTVTAGRIPEFKVEPGTIARITTGAPVPLGADAVLQVEDTLLLPEKKGGMELVRLEKAVKQGNDIRPVGYDMPQGATVLTKGTLLRPAEIGILATVGCTKVKCFQPPVVAVMSTGDEVIEPTEVLQPGKIRDSNRYSLLAAMKEMGVKSVDLGIASDTEESLRTMITDGLSQADILLTSGGVSMGELDLIQPILQGLSGTIHFGRVKMKPGKPLTFASVDFNGKKRLVFGLPGNPVSSVQALKLDPERPEYHRANLSWDTESNMFMATSTGTQASSRLLSLCSANALLLLPQESGILPAGSIVPAFIIGPL